MGALFAVGITFIIPINLPAHFAILSLPKVVAMIMFTILHQANWREEGVVIGLVILGAGQIKIIYARALYIKMGLYQLGNTIFLPSLVHITLRLLAQGCLYYLL